MYASVTLLSYVNMHSAACTSNTYREYVCSYMLNLSIQNPDTWSDEVLVPMNCHTTEIDVRKAKRFLIIKLIPYRRWKKYCHTGN